MAWEVEFFEEEGGRYPVREFLDDLEPAKRMAMIAAIEVILMPRGLAVCETEYGRQLGDGLFEFRVRHDEQTTRAKIGDASAADGARRRGDVLLRLFCHAYGQKVVLLLGGYDKGADPSGRRQSREIEKARRRLRSFRLRRERAKAAARRRS